MINLIVTKEVNKANKKLWVVMSVFNGKDMITVHGDGSNRGVRNELKTCTRFLDFSSISVVLCGGLKPFHLDFWLSLKQLYEIFPVFLTPRFQLHPPLSAQCQYI